MERLSRSHVRWPPLSVALSDWLNVISTISGLITFWGMGRVVIVDCSQNTPFKNVNNGAICAAAGAGVGTFTIGGHEVCARMRSSWCHYTCNCVIGRDSPVNVFKTESRFNIEKHLAVWQYFKYYVKVIDNRLRELIHRHFIRLKALDFCNF